MSGHENQVENEGEPNTEHESSEKQDCQDVPDAEQPTCCLLPEEQQLLERIPTKTKSSKPRAYQVLYRVLGSFLPWMHWLPDYRHQFLSKLLGDVSAGITVAILLIPQAMAYALVAGLDPVYGLYSAFVPVLVYALLGTSRQLAVGPVAIMSLMTQSAIVSLAPKNESDYITYAHLLALVSGGMQIIMGLLRLGFIVNFLAHTVISGFTAGAAIIIGGSQLKHALGVSMANEDYFYNLVWKLARKLPETNWPTLLMFIIMMGIILFLQFFAIKIRGKRITLKRIPSSLVVVIASTLTVYIFYVAGGHYDEEKVAVYGIKTIGAIPSGLAGPIFPFWLTNDNLWTWEKWQTILLSSLSISLIGFLESISVAKFFALKNKYQVSANQELIALGAASVCAGIFQGYPIAGGFSRSSVQSQAGAKTQLSGVISAFMVMLTLLLLTPLLFFLPYATLAAMIIFACLRLIDIGQLIYALRTKKRDGLLWILACFLTLMVGVEYGILIAAGISLFLILFRMSRPRVAVLGRLPGTTHYRNVRLWKDAIRVPGVLVLRFDSDIFFANANFLQDVIVSRIHSCDHPVSIVILDCSSISQIDSTAPMTFKQLKSVLRDTLGIELYLAKLKMALRKVFERANVIEPRAMQANVKTDKEDDPTTGDVPAVDTVVAKETTEISVEIVELENGVDRATSVSKGLRKRILNGLQSRVLMRRTKKKEDFTDNYVFLTVHEAVVAAMQYVINVNTLEKANILEEGAAGTEETASLELESSREDMTNPAAM